MLSYPNHLPCMGRMTLDECLEQNLPSAASPASEERAKNPSKLQKKLSKASMYLGMGINCLGKTVGISTMGASGVSQIMMSLASTCMVYEGARMIALSDEKAMKYARKAGFLTGLAGASAVNLLSFPISLTAKGVEQVGKILIKPGKKELPEGYKNFDASFKTHIYGASFGIFGKNQADPNYIAIGKKFEKKKP